MLFGAGQLLVDYIFLTRQSVKYKNVASLLGIMQTGLFDEKEADSLRDSFDQLGRGDEGSNTFSLVVEAVLVLVAATMLFVEVVL